MRAIKVKCTFTEGLLGTSTGDPEIYRNYLAGKVPADKVEVIEQEAAAIGESVDEEFSRTLTIFPKENGVPYQYDYQWKGYFKDSCGMLSRLTGKDPETGKKLKAVNESSKIKAFKKEIDGNIFVFPRKIPIEFEGKLTVCQRPLRASTAQGERIALSASEEAPAGSTMTFWILAMNDSLVPAIKEWMDYGILRGTGQWRNSGKGRFTYEILEEKNVSTIQEAIKVTSM